MKKIVLGFVGERGAGKDTAAEYIISKYSASTHRYSAGMRDCLKILGLPMSTENLIAFSEYTRRGRKPGEGYFDSEHEFSWPQIDECLNRLGIHFSVANRDKMIDLFVRSGTPVDGFGEDLYAKVIAQDCRNDDKEILVVNGIRRMADVVFLGHLPEYRLLYITAPVEERYRRVKNRGEKVEEKDLTLEQFKATEIMPTEIDIPEIGKGAHYTIYNLGDKEKVLFPLLDAIIGHLRALPDAPGT